MRLLTLRLFTCPWVCYSSALRSAFCASPVVVSFIVGMYRAHALRGLSWPSCKMFLMKSRPKQQSSPSHAARGDRRIASARVTSVALVRFCIASHRITSHNIMAGRPTHVSWPTSFPLPSPSLPYLTFPSSTVFPTHRSLHSG